MSYTVDSLVSQYATHSLQDRRSVDILHLDTEKTESILKFVREEWNILYKAKTLQDPLFESIVVEDILVQIVKNWIALERYFSKPLAAASPLSAATNILITGVKGVGKTTLMKGIYHIIDKHKQHAVPLYVDYEQHPSLLKPSLLLEPKFEGPFTEDTYNDWALKHNKGVIFFGDEVQTLYDGEEQSKLVVKEILCVGKSHYAMGIISGSSAHVKRLVHKEDLNDISKGYANLNNSVYSERHLLAVRTKEELVKISHLHNKPNCDIDDLFLKTGGVGRTMDAYFKGTFTESMLANVIKEMELDSKLQTVLQKIFIKNNGTNKEQFNLWNQQGLSNREIQTLGEGFLSNLDTWRDKAILYFNATTHTYELLVPYYMILMREYYNASLTRLQNLAFEVTLRGWEGFGSAGQVLEVPILRRICQNNLAPFKSCIYEEEELVATEPKSTTHIPFATFQQKFKNRLVATKQDFGLDGVMISEGDNQLEVHILQIKCGEYGKKITKGNRKNGDETRELIPIVHKAEHGWDKLLPLLQKHFPQSKFHLSSFTLFTSKTTNKDVQSMEHVTIKDAKVTFYLYDQETFNDLFSTELKQINLV